MYDITLTLQMPAYALYTSSHPLFMTSTIVVIILHPLHSWHHTPYIWYHTHGYINVISAIWPAISNTTSTVSVSSKLGINYNTTTLCMISNTLYVWHRIHYACYQNNCLWHHTPLCITSQQAYLWHHIQCICYHHNAFMTTQRLYLASHPPYMTSQPLYVCHHTDGTHICIDVSLLRRHHNKCVSHHTWHTCHIIPNLKHITFTVYDINDHVLWHHKHFIHDIRSPLYDITSTL